MLDSTHLHPLPYPLTLSDPHEGITPHKYVIVSRSQFCTCCHSTHNWSECYALTHIRPQMGRGKYISNLRHVDRPKYNLPIETISPLKTDLIPFCHDCFQPSLANTPGLLDPPPVDQTQILGFRAEPKPPPAPVNEPEPEKREKKKRVTALDIMEMLK